MFQAAQSVRAQWVRPWHAWQVRCSASAQPSRRRSERLRQAPRPILDREERLRKLQQEQLENENAAGLAAAEEFLLGKEDLEEEEQGDDKEQQQQQQQQQQQAATATRSSPTEQPEAAALDLIRKQPPQPATEPGPDPVGYLGPPPPGVLDAQRPLQQPQQQQQQEQDGLRQQRQWEGGELPRQQQQPQQEQGQQQPQQSSRELVEADEIHEPFSSSSGVLDELVDEEEDPALRRKSELLLDIMSSGEQVEQRIQQHQDDIDGDMLQLLTKRIELAAALQQNEAVEGLQLLYRRLKAEVDRKAASPAMRLLDDLLNILDPSSDDSPPAEFDSVQADDTPGPAASGAAAGEGGGGSSAALLQAGARAMLQQREARRQRAVTRMQAAFGLGLPEDADVVALAAQLAEGGEQVAEGLFGEPVDPERFLAEVSDLLDQAGTQREQVAEYLESLGTDREQHRAEVEAALEQRDQAMALVQEVLELVTAFTSRQRQQQRLQAMM